MRELALIALLIIPNIYPLSSIRDNLNDYLQPKTTIVNSHPEIPDLLSGPLKTTNEEPVLAAQGAYSIDLASSNLLVAKNQDQRLQIASLTKLMTAYVVLKNHPDLAATVAVPNYQVSSGNAVVGIGPGEKLNLADLLSATLISSAADAATTLAIYDSGSTQAFAEKMNEAATDLGLTNTHFANPVGDDNDSNYSSAKDITNLTRVLLTNDFFATTVAIKTKTITTVTGRQIQLASTNQLLGSNGYLGVKTGYTQGAGECLVSLQEVSGHKILTTMIGSSSRFSDTTALNTWTQSHFLW